MHAPSHLLKYEYSLALVINFWLVRIGYDVTIEKIISIFKILTYSNLMVETHFHKFWWSNTDDGSSLEKSPSAVNVSVFLNPIAMGDFQKLLFVIKPKSIN